MNGVWRGEAVPRIILGTVQLGMPYGIANTAGQPGRLAATAVVERALAAGIYHYDSAQAYGESEAVLGHAFAALGARGRARVSTKLSAALDPGDLPAIHASIASSFERLRVDRLWCLLLHQPAWLAQWHGPLGDALREYRRLGRIEHLGVSLLSPEEPQGALDNPDISVIQVPCNAWDRRAMESGLLDAARAKNKLCCVRSIYLQGLLTLSPEAVGERLPAAAAAARRWHDLLRAWGMTPPEAAVRFARTLDAPLVVGAESAAQIAETARLASLPPLPQDQVSELAAAMDPLLNREVLEPWRWQTG